MKTLEEFNEERVKEPLQPCKNGIECPNCKEELYDTSPSAVLTSYPPQKKVNCMNCNFKGLRYA